MVMSIKSKNTRLNYKDYLPLWAKVSFNQLALYGVHIGHSVNNLSPYSSGMVLGSRQGLCLINMFKFMYMFRAGLFIIQALIRRRSPIWFINLDQSSQSIVKSAAVECGEYGINDNGINGLLTNFHRITRAARRIIKTPGIMRNSRQQYLTKNFRHGTFTRHTGPRAVFVSNAMMSYNACQEAMNLRIPTVGIVDTNSPQKYVNIAVPGNDESFSSVGFYNNLVSMFVLYNKFAMVNVWYLNRLSHMGKDAYTNIANTIYNVKNYSFNASTKYHVNLNEFAFTSPISNIKYGTLRHYQDVWKRRGVQLMYDLSKPNQILRKDLASRIRAYYSNNTVWLHTLRNIYKYNKRWARALKIRRKNRRFKVRIVNIRKSAKLFKHAWHFLKHGQIKNSRLLRTQTYNFGKVLRFASSFDTPQPLMQMYRRYFRRSYWFPKSQSYMLFRQGVYNLLSTGFFVQFLRKRPLFGNFFHRFSLPLTSAIKETRSALRKAETKHIRYVTRLENMQSSTRLKPTRFINLLTKKNNMVKSKFTKSSIQILNKPHNHFKAPGQVLYKHPWYLRVIGLRYSVKRDVFIKPQQLSPLKLGGNVNNCNIDIFSSKFVNSGRSLTKTITRNRVTNYCIKYVYNQWLVASNNSKYTNSNMLNYYYTNNLSLLKPLTSVTFLNTFTSLRPYYIKHSKHTYE